MNHFVGKFLKHGRRIGTISVLSLFTLVTLLGLFSTFLINSPSAYAAIPSDSALKKQGEESQECQNVGDKSKCADYYVQGYKNPSGSASDACKNVGAFVKLYCDAGYPAGQRARKAADSSGGNQNNGLDDSQIAALGKSSSACSALFILNQPDCITGYVGGYKGGNSADDVCSASTVSSKDNCKKGYEAGKSDKAANVKTEADQKANEKSATPQDNGDTTPTCEASG